MENKLLSGIIKQFDYYKTAGDKIISQLSFEDMNYRPNEDSNSISIIVKHMVGNMLSRWTNFMTEDGEKGWRQRDQEFESSYTTEEEILEAWEKGWTCLFDALSPLEGNDLSKIISIRNETHTVAEAIFRQLGHYSYHIGQMAYIGKMLKGDQWISLSIPKGSSISYNQDKLSQNKSTIS
ncbi:MAG: DinB family protein [Gelidibacter sp.]